MKEHEKEIHLWNDIYKESRPTDLRQLHLSVDAGFDECLRDFGKKTRRVLDFGCGTGDIAFQYIQEFPEKSVVGIDEAEVGIAFAKETARLSQYRRLHFFVGGKEMLEDFEDQEFDGILLSNVLDVMPEQADEELLKALDRVLAVEGYWLIKLNPYYTAGELRNLSYEKEKGHLYEKDGILRLHQETTAHWKRIFEKYGRIERYVEFEYPWQEGMNRLFLLQKQK